MCALCYMLQSELSRLTGLKGLKLHCTTFNVESINIVGFICTDSVQYGVFRIYQHLSRYSGTVSLHYCTDTSLSLHN